MILPLAVLRDPEPNSTTLSLLSAVRQRRSTDLPMQPVAMHTNMLRHRDDNKESRPVDVGGEENLDTVVQIKSIPHC